MVNDLHPIPTLTPWFSGPVMPPPADVFALAESIHNLYPDEFRELAKALWRCGVRLERVETKP